MKRKIKFRGIDTDDCNRGNAVTFTLDELLATSDEYGLVDPDSAEQLIGIDENEQEVYENDRLVCIIDWHDFLEYRQTLTADMSVYNDIRDGYLVLDTGDALPDIRRVIGYDD